MEEQLISFETAKLAREKGFNEVCKYGRNNFEIKHPTRGLLRDLVTVEFPRGQRNSEISQGAAVAAPTQSLLQKWLREKHNINVFIDYGYGYEYKIFSYFKRDGTFVTYEQALENGLLEALKLI
jgi:hypothetical protein